MGIFLRTEECEGGLSYIQVNTVVISTVGQMPMIHLRDKLFIPNIEKNLKWGFIKMKQNYCCGYKNIKFTLNLNIMMFCMKPFCTCSFIFFMEYQRKKLEK
jgi:hypothetical protein